MRDLLKYQQGVCRTPPYRPAPHPMRNVVRDCVPLKQNRRVIESNRVMREAVDENEKGRVVTRRRVCADVAAYNAATVNHASRGIPAWLSTGATSLATATTESVRDVYIDDNASALCSRASSQRYIADALASQVVDRVNLEEGFK